MKYQSKRLGNKKFLTAMGGDSTDRHKQTKGAFGKAYPLVKMKRVNLGQNWRTK